MQNMFSSMEMCLWNMGVWGVFVYCESVCVTIITTGIYFTFISYYILQIILCLIYFYF